MISKEHSLSAVLFSSPCVEQGKLPAFHTQDCDEEKNTSLLYRR